MIAHMSYVLCDRCGNPSEMGDDSAEARELAARQGYLRLGAGRNAEDLCKRCAWRAGLTRAKA